MKTPAAYFGDPFHIDRVYARPEKAELDRLCRFPAEVVNLENFDGHAAHLAELEVIFTTWGMPRLEAAHLERMPLLRAVFYGAGSVKTFAEPLLERGITVVSARQVNAKPTAEFACAQILLSMKGYFHNLRDYRGPESRHTAFRGPGNYEESVALLGLGSVATHVCRLLHQTDVRILAYDPCLNAQRAASLRVEPVSLEAAFTRAYVVSNHMPSLPETRRILGAGHFSSMRPHATFINTARGAIVDEPAMIEVLRVRPDLQALLDVTDPEPPAPSSPLMNLPNVCLSSHIAGSINREVFRLGRSCVAAFRQWKADRKVPEAVTAQEFASMA